MTKLKKYLDIALEVVKEVATLKRPVTAASVASVVLVAAGVLGQHPSAEAVAGVIAGVGGVAAIVEKVLNDVESNL